MPVKLNMPEDGGEGLRLQSGFRGPIRVSADWRKAVREIENRNRSFEALMHTVLICTSLWSGFWIQAVVGVLSNTPGLYTLTGGDWYLPTVDMYLPAQWPFQCSLAGAILGLSVFGSVMAIFGGWFWTRGVKGRWRMRVPVLGFASWLVFWSLVSWMPAEAAWDGLVQERERLAEELWMSSDLEWRPFIRGKMQRIDWLLNLRPGNAQ